MNEKKFSDIEQEEVEENKTASDVGAKNEKNKNESSDSKKSSASDSKTSSDVNSQKANDAEAGTSDDANSSEDISAETDEKSDGDIDEKKELEDEKKKEPEESSDARYMRLAADFQNFKRRVEKEKKDIYQYANEKIALDIIDVIDNFERALQHNDVSEDKKFAEGVDLIYKQLRNVLEKNNIIEIKAEGEDFDPNFHNAIMAEENPDYESGKVIQALQKGYTLNGKVIRPSMVRVAQ